MCWLLLVVLVAAGVLLAAAGVVLDRL